MESHEISRHRVYCCPRHQARRVEMVGIGCGHGGIGPRAEQSSGGGHSREGHRPGARSKKGATCSAPSTSTMSGAWDRDLAHDLDTIRDWGAAAIVTLL